MIRIGQKSFALAGRFDDHLLEFRYSTLRRKLSFDHVEQRSVAEYLQLGRVVSFANTDIELVRGGSEFRRRFLDFLGAQIEPSLSADVARLRARVAFAQRAAEGAAAEAA